MTDVAVPWPGSDKMNPFSQPHVLLSSGWPIFVTGPLPWSTTNQPPSSNFDLNISQSLPQQVVCCYQGLGTKITLASVAAGCLCHVQ